MPAFHTCVINSNITSKCIRNVSCSYRQYHRHRKLGLNNSHHLDLCHTSIYKQFDTCNITTVIRSKERDDFSDFVRTSHTPHRYAGHEASLYLLDLFLTLYHAIEDRCIDITRRPQTWKFLTMNMIDSSADHCK